MKKIIVPGLLFILFSLNSLAQADSLRQKIGQTIIGKKATIGVAILSLEDGDTLTWNGNMHFPMQSAYKFHLALAVLDRVQNGTLSLDQDILIRKSELREGTWSPLHEKYPEGNVNLPLKDILGYTVSESDNNGCDILFRLLGGPLEVNSYIAGTGIPGISIAATEEEMHKDWEAQYTNWCIPWSGVRLLQKFYRQEVLTEPRFTFLWQLMTATVTGSGRIKGLLPQGSVVAHKSGSSGSNGNGITAATNDIGIICLPNGKHIAIAVFVSDSSETEAVNEGIIASIAFEAWNYFLQKKQAE